MHTPLLSESSHQAAVGNVEDDARRLKAMEAALQAAEEEVTLGPEPDPDSAIQIMTERRERLARMKEIMGISAKEFQRLQSRLRRFHLGRLMFSAVIAGCELDLVTYAMTAHSHWESAQNDWWMQVLIRVFVILGPVGYIGAALTYMYFGIRPGTAHANDTGCYAREAVTLKPQHFLPIWRDVLLLLPMTPNDVECLFRVNALSSFTLGFSVCCSILLQIAAAQELHAPVIHAVTTPPPSPSCTMFQGCQYIVDLNNSLYNFWMSLGIFSQFNICTQLLNIFITVQYFTSGISHWMRSATEVERLDRKFKKVQGNDRRAYDVICKNQDRDEVRVDLAMMASKLNVELQCFSGFQSKDFDTPLWDNFDQAQLDQIRQFYHLKMVSFFAEI
jgi:hypothetical protein